MNSHSFAAIAIKTTVVHTVTYFLIGLLASTSLDYPSKFADPAAASLMRQLSDPLVAAGPLFQVLRGILFGLAFYLLREIVFVRKNGWLTLWLILAILGILSPFGAAPGSMEGLIYTRLPLWFHLMVLPEILMQAFLLAILTHYWVNHPANPWLHWALGVMFALVILMSIMGILAGLGMLTTEVGAANRGSSGEAWSTGRVC
jgi:hypothetical protein